MKNRVYISIYFMALIFLISGCSSKNIQSPISFDEDYLNNQLQIRAPQDWNTYKTGDQVAVELKYDSIYEVTMPSNYNVRFFIYESEQWVEINEEPTIRTPANDVILSPNVGSPSILPVVFFPEFPDKSKSYLLRIYVIGEMDENGSKKNVAAYTDIRLNP
jgi:hypothetical protein